MYPSPCRETENGTNGRRQVPFVYCKQRTETENGSCFPWSANVKRYTQPFALKSDITLTKYMKLSYIRTVDVRVV
jgi:hypothetical protein